MFDDSPLPCPVCGTAQHACKPADDPGGDGVGITRGVIVRRRDEGSVTLPVQRPAASPHSNEGAP